MKEGKGKEDMVKSKEGKEENLKVQQKKRKACRFLEINEAPFNYVKVIGNEETI